MPPNHFVAFLSTDPIRESNPYSLSLIKLNISISFSQLDISYLLAGFKTTFF